MTDTPSDPRLGIGGNDPPQSLPDAAGVIAGLPQDVADLQAQLEAVAARASAAPKKIKTDEDFDRYGGLIRDANDLFNRIELKRKMVKDPYWVACQRIDKWFKPLADRTIRIVDTFQQAANAHAAEKVVAARKAAEAEARKAREEEERRLAAAKAAEEAGRAKVAGTHAAKAGAAAAAAEAAAARAEASAADIVRTRTDSGILATAEESWTYEITDYDHVDLEALRPYIDRDAIEKALRRAVKIGKRKVGGVRIFPAVKAQFRR